MLQFNIQFKRKTYYFMWLIFEDMQRNNLTNQQIQLQKRSEWNQIEFQY